MVDVADTSALLAWPPVKVSEAFAVPSQLEEVAKFSPERGLLFDSQGPKLVQPSQSSIQAARDASAKTGDLSGLSPIDIEILVSLQSFFQFSSNLLACIYIFGNNKLINYTYYYLINENSINYTYIYVVSKLLIILNIVII